MTQDVIDACNNHQYPAAKNRDRKEQAFGQHDRQGYSGCSGFNPDHLKGIIRQGDADQQNNKIDKAEHKVLGLLGQPVHKSVNGYVPACFKTITDTKKRAPYEAVD